MKTLKLTRRRTDKGFALVVTTSLLVLLSVIALGFLSLSAVSLRGSSLEIARMQARANASMALQIAIGELQRHAGPDMRVTASADILDPEGTSPSNLAVTGVWKSWEGTDHETTGAAAARPIPPEYDSKRRSAYASSGRFLDWLVSKPFDVSAADLISEDPAWNLSESLKKIVSNTPILDDATGKEISVPLVSGPSVAQPLRGSLAAGDPREIHVVPVTVNNVSGQRGSFAWWVGGENQKARLPVPHKPADDNDAAGWSMLAKSHAIPDPSALALDALLAPDGATKATKAMSLNTTSLLVPQIPHTPDPAKQFHDLSPSSVGLLTNTATGGWRKDLSLFTENWDLLPDTGVEIFRLTPDQSPSAISTMTKPKRTENYAEITPAGSLFYPWSRHRYPTGNLYRARAWNGAVSSWHHLKDFATLYKHIELQGGKPVMASRVTWARYAPYGGLDWGQEAQWVLTRFGEPVSEREGMFDYLHKARVIPVMARYHTVFSLRSQEITNAADPDFGKYRLQIGNSHVTTMWNPYNVTLKSTPQWIVHVQSPPTAFRFQIGGQTTDYHYMAAQNDHNSNVMENDVFTREYWVQTNYGPGTPIDCNPTNYRDGTYFRLMKPGVTTVFTGNSLPNLGYLPGRISYGNIRRRINPRGTTYQDLAFEADDVIRIDARFDTIAVGATGGVTPLVGTYYEIQNPTRNRNRHLEPRLNKSRIGYAIDVANTLWPPMQQDDFPQYTVRQLINNPTPFLSTFFGVRIASDTMLPTKGSLQSEPLASTLQTGQYALLQTQGQFLHGSTLGINNPVNAGWDFSFVSHSGGQDSRLPNASTDGEHRGYIVTGVQAGDGLSRIATVELPLRPIASLAELQHWGLRVDNIVLPYNSHIIANSEAQAIFAPNAVVGANGHANVANNLQHDDSYCANHLLFDDWFFSTIAPQPATFGPVGKTLRETFTAFVRDGAPLDNRAYRPIPEDSGLTAAQATERFDAQVDTADAYRTIASRLEVDGMFNVNSTSVKAWRALLGHARNQRMPYYNNNGNIVLSDPTDFAVSRTTVASDVAAGGNGSSGDFAGASEYSGYRVFTDEMLDQLAEEIVKQVRKRGPFLSLSEFVNRQLTSGDKELALAGAIQTALNVLAANSDNNANPYSFLQKESLDAGHSVLKAQGKDAGSDYTFFPEASEGKSVYGLPGWPRQADILRPLAPILSARDDTFTIRAYGDARDAAGKIIASAWCEAVVRRTREFVSPTDDAADITGPPTSDTNRKFGRSFQIISFRWLQADEV